MESSQLSPVAPVRPLAGYIGGKRNLAKRLCAIIDRIPHRLYAEPFVGMGGIFFRRGQRPRAEAINDISGDVATLFRVLQEHYPYFIDMLRWRVSSRVEFNRLLGMDPDRLTDLQRAARFLYLQRLAFGGKVSGRNFGVDAGAPARFDVGKLEPMLADVHERLCGVVIEQLPYGDFIRRYDRPDALFYLDPPYWQCEDDYGPGVFGRGDFRPGRAARRDRWRVPPVDQRHARRARDLRPVSDARGGDHLHDRDRDQAWGQACGRADHHQPARRARPAAVVSTADTTAP